MCRSLISECSTKELHFEYISQRYSGNVIIMNLRKLFGVVAYHQLLGHFQGHRKFDSRWVNLHPVFSRTGLSMLTMAVLVPEKNQSQPIMKKHSLLILLRSSSGEEHSSAERVIFKMRSSLLYWDSTFCSLCVYFQILFKHCVMLKGFCSVQLLCFAVIVLVSWKDTVHMLISVPCVNLASVDFPRYKAI